MDDAARRLSRYFLFQLCINSGFGVVIGIGLMLIGLPSAWLWAIMAGLLRFVPYVGSFLAAVMPVALAAAVDPGWSMMVWTGGAVHRDGLRCRASGRAAALWPLDRAFAGVGHHRGDLLDLAVGTDRAHPLHPLTLCLVVVGRYVERLEFLDVMLGDRPALTPVENFYQRMLAGDPDEAQDQAEDPAEGALALVLLRQRRRERVAPRGGRSRPWHGRHRQARKNPVRHARADRRTRRERRRRTVIPTRFRPGSRDADDSRREGAPDHGGDPSPLPQSGHLAPAWRGDMPVLCIAGRGSLDRAAAEMLKQLLEKHGLARAHGG